MLAFQPKTSYEISQVIKEDDCLVLKSERGILRLKPQSNNIVRVTYTEKEQLANVLGVGICNEQSFDNWNYEECLKSVTLTTEELKIIVTKKTGCIKYYDLDNNLLLAERDFDSHELQPFKSTKVIIDENTKIEEIETPDGIKRVIKEATEVFDKDLFHTKLYLSFQDDEKIFGLGQAEEGVLNLRGTTQYLHQANLKIAIPVMLSTAGYGILFSTGSPSIFSDTQYGTYFYTEADQQMDFYFIGAKKLDEVVKGYRFLTGKAVMLPRWAFGFMQSQERYETQQEVLDVVNEYRQRQIGIDCIVMDWMSWTGEEWGQKSFDPERFPDPRAMTDALHDTNVNFMISVWPNMREISANYNEFFDAKLLLPANNIYDAFNKDARDLYWKQANEGLFSYGVDAWWCDSSEPFCPEWTKNCKTPEGKMFTDFINTASKYLDAQHTNAYGHVHAQTMYEGQRATLESKRVTNLTRNTYLGGQKYGTILWSGDTFASWKTYKDQIVAGLNFCATGLPYWTLDIGAFFVKDGERWFRRGDYTQGLEDLGYRELFVRWFQYGAFLPVFRSHGTDIRREMWLFDGENHMFYDALIKANKLRYSLIPYIYSLAGSVYLDDNSMMKMLAFDFAKDQKATQIKNQYMFGDIMVCPVTKPMYYGVDSEPLDEDKTVEVYLPQSCDWFDFYTNEKYSGGQTITVTAEIDTIPLFVRAGSIIVKTEPLQSTNEVDNAELEIVVYSGKDCEFNLYQDSGNGYDYEKGEYSLNKIKWSEDSKSLDIGDLADVKYTII